MCLGKGKNFLYFCISVMLSLTYVVRTDVQLATIICMGPSACRISSTVTGPLVSASSRFWPLRRRFAKRHRPIGIRFEWPVRVSIGVLSEGPNSMDGENGKGI